LSVAYSISKPLETVRPTGQKSFPHGKTRYIAGL